jgi:hypothetical protein
MNRQPEGKFDAARTEAGSKWMARIGIGVSGVVALFLIVDAAMKLLQLPVVLDATRDLGWPPQTVVPLGVGLLVSTLLYLAPPTAVLGAILLTAYMGGAVAAHLRIGNPIFTHAMFGVYVGGLLWLGLFCRNPALRRALGVPPQRP